MPTPRNQRPDSGFGLRPLVFVLGLFFSLVVLAQPAFELTDFQIVLGYHLPPHEKQIKSLLKGDRVERQGDEAYLVTGGQIQTFLETGVPQMQVEAPHCLCDERRNTVNSPGPLRAQTADGKFAIEGQGFLWHQTNATLIISNRVHTTVHPDALASQPSARRANAPALPVALEVFSDRFQYFVNSGEGIYRNNVRVAGTNLLMTQKVLTLKVPMNERRLQSIIAEQNVIFDYTNADHETIHATGGRATYSADTGLLKMSGHPAWRAGQREGSGDEILIDQTNRIYRAAGNAWLKMGGRAQGGAGFFPAADPVSAKAPAAATQTIEVRSDNYELRTNLAVFRKDVRLTQQVGTQQKGQMDCGLLTVAFAGTNQMKSMVAEKGVVIEQADRGFAAGRAVYTATNGLLELTDNPTWHAGPRTGKGNRMFVNTQREDMNVIGNASMRFPAGELVLPGTNAPSRPRVGSATNQFAEVFSEEYSFRRETNVLTARFRGGVYISHTHMNLACENMTVQMPAEGRQFGNLVAEQGVTFDMVDARGQKHNGKGDKVVYTHTVTATVTNDVLVLTGSPATLQTADGMTAKNNVFTVDLGSGTIGAPGKSFFTGTAAIDTNKFRLPQKIPSPKKK